MSVLFQPDPSLLDDGDRELFEAYDRCEASANLKASLNHMVYLQYEVADKSEDQQDKIRFLNFAYEAALRDSFPGKYYLGLSLQPGMGFSDVEDADAAIYWMRAFLKQGTGSGRAEIQMASEDIDNCIMLVQYRLGYLLQQRGETECREAAQLFDESSASGYVHSHYWSALMAMRQEYSPENVEKALSALHKGADAGCDKAKELLTRLVAAYCADEKTGRDGLFHFTWLDTAGSFDPASRVEMLVLLTHPDSRFHDPDAARDLLQRSLKDKKYHSMVNMFSLHLLEQYGPEWQAYARGLLTTLADEGNEVAIVNLALALRRGDGGSVDHVAANTLMQSVIDSKDDDLAGTAHSFLGDSYLKGLGVAIDPGAAESHYLQASQRGNVDGTYNAALMADGINGGKADPARAAKLYEKIVDVHMEARTNLGLMHMLGSIPDADPDLGERLLQRSAAEGDDKAIEFLELGLNELFRAASALRPF